MWVAVESDTDKDCEAGALRDLYDVTGGSQRRGKLLASGVDCSAGGGAAVMLKPDGVALVSLPPAAPVDCYGKYKTQASCDGDRGCAWCTSGAVPPACNTIEDARTLPTSVFTCDKVQREREQRRRRRRRQAGGSASAP